VVKVLRERESVSANSRTKKTHLMSVRSIATTLPVMLSSSSLPSWTKCDVVGPEAFQLILVDGEWDSAGHRPAPETGVA
jgi:hypothetical protein